MKLVLYTFLGFSILFSPPKENHAVQFEIKNAGITVNGYFEEASATIQFNPKNIKQSKLEGRVNVSSINTGIKLRDKHVQGRQYFQSDKFPEITMKSISIEQAGKTSYRGEFSITIKDISKQVTIPFTIAKSGSKQYISADFTLNRLDFEIGEKSMVLADEVHIFLHFTI